MRVAGGTDGNEELSPAFYIWIVAEKANAAPTNTSKIVCNAHIKNNSKVECISNNEIAHTHWCTHTYAQTDA